MPGFSFKKQNQVDPATNLTDAKVIIYDDGSGNKYTFGLDVSDVFNTFKYESGGSTVDYSALATQFMTGGIAGTLLGSLGAIETQANLIPANLTARLEALNPDITGTPAANSLGATLKEIKDKTVDLSGLATAASITALGTKVAGIESKTNPIPTNLTARLDALNPDAGSNSLLGKTLKGIKDKTDKLDLANANAQGTLGEALGKLAKTTELDPLATAASITALGTKVAGIEDKTKLIPTNLTERLEVLNLADITKGLGKILKDIQDKTDNLDPEDTAEGTLGKALETISAEATANLNALKDLLDALNPDASSNSLLGATLKGIKDKTDKLDLADAEGTLGEALGKLATAQRLSEINEKLTIVELDPPKDPISSEPQSNSGYTQNEDMLGKHSPDQFLG